MIQVDPHSTNYQLGRRGSEGCERFLAVTPFVTNFSAKFREISLESTPEIHAKEFSSYPYLPELIATEALDKVFH